MNTEYKMKYDDSGRGPYLYFKHIKKRFIFKDKTVWYLVPTMNFLHVYFPWDKYINGIMECNKFVNEYPDIKVWLDTCQEYEDKKELEFKKRDEELRKLKNKTINITHGTNM